MLVVLLVANPTDSRFEATFPNGDTYSGEYTNLQRNGKGIYTFAKGGRYEGFYADGKVLC